MSWCGRLLRVISIQSGTRCGRSGRRARGGKRSPSMRRPSCWSTCAAVWAPPSVDRLIDLAARNADVPVLLLGESGTGKGLVARRIHDRSPRANGAFVVVNCASLTPALFETELFGHERGAFTDAKSVKRGLLEVAVGGTLLLDEVGDLASSAQPKLLAAIEEKIGTNSKNGSILLLNRKRGTAVAFPHRSTNPHGRKMEGSARHEAGVAGSLSRTRLRSATASASCRGQERPRNGRRRHRGGTRGAPESALRCRRHRPAPRGEARPRASGHGRRRAPLTRCRRRRPHRLAGGAESPRRRSLGAVEFLEKPADLTAIATIAARHGVSSALGVGER